MGRPRIANRTITISISVSPERLVLIDASANELGMSRSEYLVAQGCAPEAARALKMYAGLRGIVDRLSQLENDVDDLIVDAER